MKWSLLVTLWLLIAPPCQRADDGFYRGPKGAPHTVLLAEPLYNWRVLSRYPSAAECEKRRGELEMESLQLDPDDARAVSGTFAKCLPASDPRLIPGADSPLPDHK